ncbi:MAG: Fic family protein [Bacteroidales bacterium]
MNKPQYIIPNLPLNIELEDKQILKQLAISSRLLGELKGSVEKIPNKKILISALTLMEAKHSSEIESIVTTNDELYKADLDINEYSISSSAKEVMNYREAIMKGLDLLVEKKVLSNNLIKEVQQTLEGNSAGFRTTLGTTLQDNQGNVVYTPPQDILTIEQLMQNLESYINDDTISDEDYLIKLAVMHHQFESIHPFYDGNGRTGRIILILYLVYKKLLDLPILYLSHYITKHKTNYYQLLQKVRDNAPNNTQDWKEWILFILKGVAETSASTLSLITEIAGLMAEYKSTLKPIFNKVYKHELLNNLFFHPYTKIEYMQRDMMVQRKTATKYLDRIVEEGLLEKVKIGVQNYYINTRLVNLFLHHQTKH